MLPCLAFKLVSFKVSLIVGIAYSIRIVDYLGKYGVMLIIMFVIKTGKDLDRILYAYMTGTFLLKHIGSGCVITSNERRRNSSYVNCGNTIRFYFLNDIIKNPSSFLSAVEDFVWIVCYSYYRQLVDEKA